MPPRCLPAPIDLVPGSILDPEVRNLSLPRSVLDPKVRNLSHLGTNLNQLWANLSKFGTSFNGSWHNLVPKAPETNTKLKQLTLGADIRKTCKNQWKTIVFNGACALHGAGMGQSNDKLIRIWPKFILSWLKLVQSWCKFVLRWLKLQTLGSKTGIGRLKLRTWRSKMDPGTKSIGARRHRGGTGDAPRMHQGGTKERLGSGNGS